MAGLEAGTLYVVLGLEAASFEEGLARQAANLLGWSEAAVGAAAVVAAGMAAAAKEAIGYQTALQEIQNNTGATNAEMVQFGAGLQEVAARTNASLGSLEEGLTHVRNFGFQAADATKILDVAMQSASSTGGNTAKTAELVAAALHEYNLGADQAATVTDLIHVAAQRANSTFEQFAGSSSRALGVAANLHVPIEQVVSAMAALTQHGYSASEAQTQVVNILTHLIHPSQAAAEAIANLSQKTGVDLVTDFSAAGLSSKGLTGVLADLHTAFGRMGLSEEEATQQTMVLLNAQRGGLGMATLLGQGAKDYANNLTAMSAVLSGQATPTADAYARSQQTVGYQLGEMGNRAQLTAIAVGNVLLPAVAAGLAGMNALGTGIGTAVGWFAQSTPLVAGLAAGLAVYAGSLAAATVATAAQTAATVIGAAAETLYAAGLLAAEVAAGSATVATGALAGAMAFLDLTMAPLVLVIGAVALAAGALTLAWNNDFLGMKEAAADWAASVKKDADSAMWDMEGITKKVSKLGMDWTDSMRNGGQSATEAQAAALVKQQAQLDAHEAAVLGILNSQGDTAQALYAAQAADMLATWQDAQDRKLQLLAQAGQTQHDVLVHGGADWDDAARHVSAFSGTLDQAMQSAQSSLQTHLEAEVTFAQQQVAQLSGNLAIDPGPALQALDKAQKDLEDFHKRVADEAYAAGADTGQAYVDHLMSSFSTAVPEFDRLVKQLAATGDQQALFGMIGAADAAAYRLNLMLGMARAMSEMATAMKAGGSSVGVAAATALDGVAAIMRAGAIRAGQATGILPKTLEQQNTEIEAAQAKAAANAAKHDAARGAADAKREAAAQAHAAAMAKHASAEQVAVADALGKLVVDSEGKSTKWSEVIQGMVSGAQKATELHMPALAAVFNSTLAAMDSATPPTMAHIHDVFLGALQHMAAAGPGYMRDLATGYLSQVDALNSAAAAKEQEAAAKFTKDATSAFETLAKSAAEAATKLSAARLAVTEQMGTIAAAVSSAGTTIQSQFKGLWDLAQQATQAGMSGLASTITGWLQAAANGTAPPMGQIRDTIIARLREAAAGGDLQLRLLAQAALQHLSEMAADAAAKATQAEEEVGRHLHQMYLDAEKAAADTKAAVHSAMEGLLQGLASAGQAAADKSKSATDVIVQLMPLMQQAVAAGMPQVAAMIQHWMDQARSGVAVNAQEIYRQITQWLQAAEQSGDASLALLAQQGAEHLQQLSQAFNPVVAAAQAELTNLNTGLQQDQAALQAQGEALKAAQAQVQGYQTQLQQAQTDLQNFTNAQLQGTQAFKDAKASNTQASNALTLAANQLQLGGDKSQIVAGLQAQLQQVQAQNAAQEAALAARVAGASAADRPALQAQLEALRANDAQAVQALQQGIGAFNTGSTQDQLKALQDILRRVGLEGQNINLAQSLQLDPLKAQLDAIAHPIQELTFQQMRDGALAASQRIGLVTRELAAAQAHVLAMQAAQTKMQAAIEQDNAAIAAQQALIQHLQQGTQAAQAGLQQMTTTAQTFGTTITDVSVNALAPMVANFTTGLAALPPAFDSVFGPGPGTVGYKIFGHDPDSFLPKLDSTTRSLFALYVGQGGPWAQGLTVLSGTMTTGLGNVQADIRPAAQEVGLTMGTTIREAMEGTFSGLAAAAAAGVRAAIEAAQAAAGSGGSGAGGNAPTGGAHGASHAPGYAPVGITGGFGGPGGGNQPVILQGTIIVQERNGSRRQMEIVSADLSYQQRVGSLAGGAA